MILGLKITRLKKMIKLTVFQKKIIRLIEFFAILSLASIPLYLINALNINLYPIQYFEASCASLMLNLFSVPHVLTEAISYDTGYEMPVITAGTESLGIDRACTGLAPMLAFLGLVIASPKNNKKKALVYLPAIFSLNIIRLFILGIVSWQAPSMIEIIHSLLWSFGLVLAVFLLWAKWFKS